ncbi:sensor histidine kinase [Dyadobacter sp. CY326]|uniref:sensor histidine kinase n=1 Tax=Dyadobacter sp. CY326 TaxID=2907300 RepID=UPI001F39CEFB|nr:sensor histidine kinase [Dyadobacter sp. CY326]MCE7064566.1 sensor histidine kinase [Dyadobacter sp. CY326]
MKPRFFSRYEWWYHLAMMPVFFAVGNYYFIGEKYFTSLDIFLPATALVFVLYWFSIITLTMVVRWVINRYPHVDQTRKRLLITLLAVGGLTLLLAVFDVWAYSLVPRFAVTFKWPNIWPIMILGAFFDIFLCAMLGLFYSLEQWRNNQAESEKLERQSLQHQFDALKGQVNPHFLFNSLNTLSALIGDDQAKAEIFVEDLARIYRYILQGSKTDLVPVQAEFEFLQTYARLLNARYGESLQIIQPEPYAGDLFVPPLVLQVLVDNAIKFNTMTKIRPLIIRIEIAFSQRIRVQNNMQSKVRPMLTDQGGLSELKAKYHALSNREVRVEQTEAHFVVTLPMLSAKART